MKRGTPVWVRERGAEAAGAGEEPGAEARAESEAGAAGAGEDPGAEAGAAGTGQEAGTGAEADAEEGTPAAEADSPATAEDGAEDARPVRTRWARRRTLAVALGSVLLLLAGCVLLQQAHSLRHTSGAANHALTDAEASDRVSGDVGNALARIFSYTPDGMAGTERSARAALAGKAARQYEALLGRVREDVRTQRVTLSTQSVRVGVVSLRGDTAHLLVFLDQTARRGDEKATTSAAQLSVTARLDDGVWRVVDLTAR
ncbi:hypothetical protein ACFY1V_28565 [Streptomyces sp. NPDC001255]|uniref:hypothetical protein n=1 Tax=Streptomyces sp. NPDC001255 TaxID=3364550 RepID=UPI0036A636CF